MIYILKSHSVIKEGYVNHMILLTHTTGCRTVSVLMAENFLSSVWTPFSRNVMNNLVKYHVMMSMAVAHCLICCGPDFIPNRADRCQPTT